MIFKMNKTDAIVAYLFEHPDERVKVTEVAKALKVNKGSVSLTVKKLEASGMMKGRRIDISNPTVRAMKVLITIMKLKDTKAMKILKEHAVSAGLYGSSAKGMDTDDSDIDIWIRPKSDFGRIEIINLSRKLSEELGKRVQLVEISDAKLKNIKHYSVNFYYSLVFGSVMLLGDSLERT